MTIELNRQAAAHVAAGGTAGMTVILRSGAYVTHDHGYYGTVSPARRGSADAPGLRPALELRAQVLSRPEPGLALLGAGCRDAGFDGPGARRSGVPGHPASVHHAGQMADDPGGERRRARDRYGARLFITPANAEIAGFQNSR
jgi:D-serine deaminase-like pyridoxal phosphate-dependent protein